MWLVKKYFKSSSLKGFLGVMKNHYRDACRIIVDKWNAAVILKNKLGKKQYIRCIQWNILKRKITPEYQFIINTIRKRTLSQNKNFRTIKGLDLFEKIVIRKTFWLYLNATYQHVHFVSIWIFIHISNYYLYKYIFIYIYIYNTYNI